MKKQVTKRNRKVQPYKGHKSYIESLGKFVVVFEDIINKQLTSETLLKQRFPDSWNYFKQNIKKFVGYSTSDKLDRILNKKGKTLVYNGNNCLIYDLCRHIRNSFCHLLLEVDGDILKVTDKSRGKITSKGYLQKSSLLNFIKSIVREYEEKND